MVLGFGNKLGSTSDTIESARLVSQGPLGAGKLAAGKAVGFSATTTSKLSTWFSNNWLRLTSFLKTIPSYFQRPFTMSKLLLYAALFGLVVVIILFVTKTVRIQGFENPEVAVDAADASRRVDKLIVNATENHDTNDDYKLINLQPVCFKQAAYLGNNVFDSSSGILEQLRLGSRSFFLQIDYFESDNLDKDKFGKVYEPVLIWRQDAKNLSSKNSASLQNTFQSILNNYNNDSIPFHNYPVIIMLHFIRLPSDVEKYIKKVSDTLKIFTDVRIKGFAKANKESDLFNNKFSDFNNQIIIGTNINTTLKERLELNKKIHFRYYVKETETVDATSVAADNSVNAYIYNADTLLNKTSAEKDRFTELHMNKFVIVKPSNDQNLSKDQVDRLLNKFKVNVVLHDYFSDGLDNSKKIFGLYNNSCYKIKSTS